MKDDWTFVLSNVVSLETQRHFAKLQEHWSSISIECFRYLTGPIHNCYQDVDKAFKSIQSNSPNMRAFSKRPRCL